MVFRSLREKKGVGAISFEISIKELKTHYYEKIPSKTNESDIIQNCLY